jgi:hypothetical protein
MRQAIHMAQSIHDLLQLATFVSYCHRIGEDILSQSREIVFDVDL